MGTVGATAAGGGRPASAARSTGRSCCARRGATRGEQTDPLRQNLCRWRRWVDAGPTLSRPREPRRLFATEARHGAPKAALPRRRSRPNRLGPLTRLDGRTAASSHQALGGPAGAPNTSRPFPPRFRPVSAPCRSESAIPSALAAPLSPLSAPFDVLPSPRQPEVETRVPRETHRRRRTQHVPYVVGLRVESANMPHHEARKLCMAAAEAAKLLRRRSGLGAQESRGPLHSAAGGRAMGLSNGAE